MYQISQQIFSPGLFLFPPRPHYYVQTNNKSNPGEKRPGCPQTPRLLQEICPLLLCASLKPFHCFYSRNSNWRQLAQLQQHPAPSRFSSQPRRTTAGQSTGVQTRLLCSRTPQSILPRLPTAATSASTRQLRPSRLRRRLVREPFSAAAGVTCPDSNYLFSARSVICLVFIY